MELSPFTTVHLLIIIHKLLFSNLK